MHLNNSGKLVELYQQNTEITNEKSAGKALAALKACSPQVLTATLSDGTDPLAVFQPSQSPVIYAAVLHARFSTSGSMALLPFALHFAESADYNQLRWTLEVAVGLAESLGAWAERNSVALSVLKPLILLCGNLGGEHGILTPLHPIMAKYCLLAKHPRAALPILNADITVIDLYSGYLQYQDNLLYHYYGGILYILLKKFDRALDFFQVVVSAPAAVTSAIQIEAHRKYILVSLLLHGKVLSLPKYTAQPVTRTLRNQNVPYEDFAKAYESHNHARVNAEITKYQQAFTNHHNFGLIIQCRESLMRRNIQQLTQTYLTLSLADIAKSVGLKSTEEAERHVLQMIEEGQVHATINHKEGGMVYFRDAPSRFDDQATVRLLNQQIGEANFIAGRVGELDKRLALTKDYLTKTAGGERGGAGAGMMATSFDDDILMMDEGTSGFSFSR
ncbi:COP9 signalosome complex subunit 3 [Rhizophlyctis rosea]|nr:COP9 signalosome complex subunit 3 [Rhizophlyctis rosea]